MKIVHLSDLHIGKRVNDFSMIEDQEYILSEILKIIDSQSPEAIVIAGDVFDKSVPSAEAVELCDMFFYSLSVRGVEVFVISGNHDSPERLSFGSRLMDRSGIHISRVYDGGCQPITLCDSFGDVNFYMLPFLKPVNVRKYYPDDNTDTYTDALRCAVEHMDVDRDKRNILITHQFVTGAQRCESEEISVGGTDNVDVSVFDRFDYVALGHIHGPQSVVRETVRYSGTPLKYSFSEASHQKSVTVVELGEKGSVDITTVPLIPKRDMLEIKGKYDELTFKGYYENIETDSYMHITLTDEEDIPDAIGKLRVIYPNIMKLDYDNKRTAAMMHIDSIDDSEHKTPFDYFALLYEMQNNQPMTEEQTAFITQIIEEMGGDVI